MNGKLLAAGAEDGVLRLRVGVQDVYLLTNRHHGCSNTSPLAWAARAAAGTAALLLPAGSCKTARVGE